MIFGALEEETSSSHTRKIIHVKQKFRNSLDNTHSSGVSRTAGARGVNAEREVVCGFAGLFFVRRSERRRYSMSHFNYENWYQPSSL